jgi:hypothetical protein
VHACHRLGRIDEHPVKSGQMNTSKEFMPPLARRPLNSGARSGSGSSAAACGLSDCEPGGGCSGVYWSACGRFNRVVSSRGWRPSEPGFCGRCPARA